MTQTNKQSIKKAGAIIFNNVNFDKVILLYRSKQNDWSFPKGHIDREEDSINTMEREIKEETGLAGRVISKLPDLEYKNNKGENVVVFMYLLVSQEQDDLRTEHFGDKVEWFNKDKVIDTLTHSNLKEYFKNNLSKIEDMLNRSSRT